MVGKEEFLVEAIVQTRRMTVRNAASFSISAELLKDDPNHIAEIFACMGFVATRAEFNFSRNEMDYEGISRIFEPVSEIEIPPHVKLQVNSSESGEVESVRAVPA